MSPACLHDMGTVHKFERPPRNQHQFQGYRPPPLQKASAEKLRRRQLGGWQRSAIAWLALVLLSAGIWAVGFLLGDA